MVVSIEVIRSHIRLSLSMTVWRETEDVDGGALEDPSLSEEGGGGSNPRISSRFV
jgi:hypothetical protein